MASVRHASTGVSLGLPFSLLLILCPCLLVRCEVLTPPYFNLAENRRITATATCGEAVPQAELYCKLVGANADKDVKYNLIQGQVCDICDPTNPNKWHPPHYAIDGSERWWQSPPLSRGMQYNQVNLTVDLGQLFQVAYVLIKMGNSPRPGIWVLERSVNNGESYSPWQYFADSPSDCEKWFGVESLNPIVEDDDVTCTTQFSKVVPLEGGEIVVSLLNERPSSKSFFNSTVLQEFTRATNVRLRLLRTKTLLGHLMSVARQDPTVTRRYFYSVKDISIGGRCVCNGHAGVCDIADPDDPYKLQCRCQHNTCGTLCGSCCPGYIQKKWRPASYSDAFVCEPCNCHGHSEECNFDELVNANNQSKDIHGIYEGGGVCQNCRDFTEGINCEKCVNKYFRPQGKLQTDVDGCQPCRCYDAAHTGNCEDGTGRCECRIEFMPPYCDQCNFGYYDYPRCKPCDCFRDGTKGGICEVGGGQCPCEDNFKGLNCNQCKNTFYGFPACSSCNCSDIGSTSPICDSDSGQCNCVSNFGGQTCDRCEHGYYNYPKCEFCNCDSGGTSEEICDKATGRCLCKEGYSGIRCDNSAPGFWGYPLIKSCQCHPEGSVDKICDADGRCRCFSGYSGSRCDQCRAGFYKFPECKACNCERSGSTGDSCDEEGNCYCKFNFAGQQCRECREGFYIFPRCEECNCNPAGVIESFGGCDKAPEGSLCVCKPRVRGRICDQCESLFWNLQPYNPEGCEECSCIPAGTVGGLAICNSDDGQCTCKPRVTDRRCGQCMDGSFNLMEDNLFGCLDCGCNRGGSLHSVCDKLNGNCQCRPRVVGQRCDKPIDLHYFPSFHHLKYEAEDGRTTYTDAVRFGYDETQFPGYSWRGYAIFSELQHETLYDVVIERPSLYRIIFFYRNPHQYNLAGKITITPESPSYTLQEVPVVYPPTPNGPELMTVSRETEAVPRHLVMDPGHWTISIASDNDILLDYFVLLPSAYYEGTLLTQNITSPCRVGPPSRDLCIHYSYPDVQARFPYAWGSSAYTVESDGRHHVVETFNQEEIIRQLKSSPMAWLNEEQSEVHFTFRIMKQGPHVILLNYFTPQGDNKAVPVVVEAHTQKSTKTGRAILYDCGYSWTCRQVVTDLSGKVGEVNFDSDNVNLVIKIQQAGQDIALESVAVVPVDEWHTDLITPQPVCIRDGGKCTQTYFSLATDAAKVEFESNPAGKYATWLPPGVSNETVLVYLNQSDPMVDITGSLRAAGDYVFVVHYYQPNMPGFPMQVLVQNGKFYEGKLELAHCPRQSGCRAIITHTDGQIVFNILENFVLTLKEPGRQEVWVDYLLVVPAALFSPSLLESLPRDNTADFINRCGDHHFKLSENTTGFCRDAAFALTTEFNGGALYCDCDYYGSYTIECEDFGGACPCKPNVIGRRCDRCKTGYFGFPNCQPCDCPSTALCNARNGECICPPLVQGDRCDQCVANTYGFDSIIGCEECQCSRVGVRSGNLQCDLITGQCDCLSNVVGRRCERCRAGYWTYPQCQSCDCDIRGTEADICNQNDASCYCKGNVEGRTCDTCIDGSYNLEESNPDGCTRCFCFGKTSACSASKFYWDKLYKMTGWTTVQLDLSGSSLSVSNLNQDPEVLGRMVRLNTSDFLAPRLERVVYLSAPNRFLGNRITSYGGLLSYSLVYLTDGGDDELSTGDLVLQGSNMTARYYNDDPLTPVTSNNVVLRLNERNFRSLSGALFTRAQFMMLLYRLSGIYIRAQYTEGATETRLSDMTMDVATTLYYQAAEPAYSVEQCRCPVNYQGTSCEECAPGFFRAQSGPFGGFCVPCQCNRHSDICDALTGVCLNCQHNTVGEHCELCGRGFHGDATGQTPNDCLLCACPIPALSNNFADSCIVDVGRPPICDCQPGYVGQQCQQCAPGHFGNPRAIGSYCQSCQCNDNIDSQDPYACDDITGRCLRCLNHTAGDSCEVCENSYYGDAISAKDCRPCECNLCGTRTCDHRSGVCGCHFNVVGESCDRCAPDHWGLDSCQGCQSCQCGLAAVSTQCDLLTGDCQCQPGASGRFCDQCQPGYWNLTPFGCKECTCRKGFSIGVGCDPRTGVCSCLPGVQGENCDGCPHRWVLIEAVGCQECPLCIHTLLDTAEQLETMIMPTINEFETAAHSFFLNQRLSLINESAEELQSLVAGMDLSAANLTPIAEAIDGMGAQALLNNVELSREHAGQSVVQGGVLRADAQNVFDLLQEAQKLAKDVVAEINALVIGLEIGTGAQLEQALKEGEIIVNVINRVNLEDPLSNAEMERESARETLDNIKNFSIPLLDQQAAVQQRVELLRELQDRVGDIEDYIVAAQERTDSAVTLNANNRQYGLASLNNKLKQTRQTGQEVTKAVVEGEKLTKQAEDNFEMIANVYRDLLAELGEARAKSVLLNATVSTLATKLEETEHSRILAGEHTEDLIARANVLDHLLADTREVAQNALKAANAYINIVKAIEDARKAAEGADKAGQKAVSLSTGVRDDAEVTFTASQEKGSNATDQLRRVEDELKPQLVQSQMDVADLKEMTESIAESLLSINGGLTQLESGREQMNTEEETRKANEARRRSDEALRTIVEVSDRQEEDAAVARKAFNDGAEARKSMDFTTLTVGRLERDIPKIGSMAVELLDTGNRVRQRSLDLSDRLERLRMNIQKTRQLTNKVRVGVNFQEDTSVEVVPPEDPSESATSTRFSLYTRTDQPSGLLLFMGTPVGGHQLMRRTKTDDFMALEIVNGFARLTIDLGSGPDSIENRDVFLSDNVWRKISVDRTGMVVRLNIHYEDNAGTERVVSVARVLPGRFSVLNLSPKVSRVFVGGIPADVEVDNSIQSTSYSGQVEELNINGHTIGLWNFLNNGTNNIEGYGSPERNRLVDLVPPTGLRFGGSGYAVMNTRDENAFHFHDKFDINLRFKTFTDDGLLYLLHQSDSEFMAVSLVDGHVLFQLNLGSGMAVLRSRVRYNDGQWHRVEAARQEKQAIIKVDGQVQQGVTPGSARFLQGIPDTMYFGGAPHEHTLPGVTNAAFTGCIDEIVMSQLQFDLSKSKETKGTLPGCPDEVASLVSFEKHAPGFVKLGSPEGPGLKLVFKFRTSEPSGLLFYTANSDRTAYLTLALSDGALVLKAAPDVELSSGAFNQYNDSEWHVVIAARDHNELRLDIDDYDAYQVTLVDEQVAFDGPVFFGGTPPHIAPQGTISFSGCIGDATLNGMVMDFSDTDDRPNSLLQSCDLREDSVSVFTAAPPDPIPEEVTTRRSPRPGPGRGRTTTRRPSRYTPAEYDEEEDEEEGGEEEQVEEEGEEEEDVFGYSDETTHSGPQMYQCALPIAPEVITSSYSLEDGARFGSKKDSRIEYSNIPDTLRTDFEFSMDFKTFSGEGIIFYSSSISHTDFVAIYMKDGNVVFGYNVGDSNTVLSSPLSYRDNEWHSLLVQREGNKASLFIDGSNVAYQYDQDTANRYVEYKAPYFFGGLNPDMWELARGNTEGTDLSFNGCLRSFRMNNQRVEEVDNVFTVTRCSDDVEPGVFFGPGKRAHIILRSRYSVGHQFHLSMEVRPRVKSAVMMSIHGRRDFLMLQIRDGTVEFSADNGQGIIKASIKPPSPYTLCDGNWHTIQVAKVKNLVVLTVDGASDTNTGSIAGTSTDTRHPLFLGSQPRLKQRRGQPVTDMFVGCIRNVTLMETNLNLSYSTFVGNVNAGSCPIN